MSGINHNDRSVVACFHNDGPVKANQFWDKRRLRRAARKMVKMYLNPKRPPHLYRDKAPIYRNFARYYGR